MLSYWFIKDSLNDNLKEKLYISEEPLNICFEPSSIGELESGLVDLTMFTEGHDIKVSLLITNPFLDKLNNKSLVLNFVNLLFAYFFTPSYYKINGNPIIFLSTDFVENDFFLRIQTECKLQGYKNLHTLYVNDVHTLDITLIETVDYVSIVTYKIKASILSWLRHSNINDEAYPPYLVIKDTDSNTKKFKLQILEKIITKQIVTNKLYKSIKKIFLKKIQVDNLRFELQHLKEENSNLKSYLASQSKNSLELLKWYHEQYEVLPLWYKRFGHVLKVFAGKRTLRSLFKNE